MDFKFILSIRIYYNECKQMFLKITRKSNHICMSTSNNRIRKVKEKRINYIGKREDLILSLE
jgi:hypothetical protein